MIDLGFQENQKVGVYFANSVEWYLLQMACALSKTILVTINPAYRQDDLRHCINSIELDYLVTSNSRQPARVLDNVEKLVGESRGQDPEFLSLEKVPTLRKVFVIDFAGEPLENPAFLDFRQSLMNKSPSEKALETIKEHLHHDFSTDVTNIQFTSGTTGRPKGAQLTHKNILNNGYILANEMGYHGHDRICVPVPLYHCFGMVMGNLAALSHGSTVVYPSFTFNSDAALDAVEEYGCNTIYGVPTMFIDYMKKQKARPRNLRTMEKGVIAGSLCPEPLLRSIHDELNIKFLAVGYGMTETSPLSFLTRKEDSITHQTSTVGRILPHTEAKLIDEEGNTLPIGKQGELVVKGYSVMKGYYNNPEANQISLVDGWMHTGDLGIMDSEGYLQIVGRSKDIINRGGEKVAPKELEDQILVMHNVENVQVVSVPDERMGEEVLALVQLKDPQMYFDISSIKKHLEDKIAYYKIPKYVWLVESLPITVTGKPQKFKMRADWLEKVKELGGPDSFMIR
jgi:fatty-acyl-CoA synthase